MAKSKTGIPATKKIVDQAVKEFESANPKKLDPKYIEKNFSEVCESIFNYTYKIYLEYENRVWEKLNDDILQSYDKKSYSRNEIKEIIKNVTSKTVPFEKSLNQSRASRAGKSFELIVMMLLNILGIPNEHITKEDKKSGLRPIDIVIPSREVARRDKFKAKFLSLKTSLKDRWKLVVEDQTQGQRTYLLTLLLHEEKISNEMAEKIALKGIETYVPDYRKKKDFANKGEIKKLSDLPANLK